jgi:hypothetical protein
LKSIEKYSIEEDTWEVIDHIQNIPMMSSMATCTHNNIIYFGGGKNQNWSKVSDFYKLDVSSKTITKLVNMPLARTTHQLTVINDFIYVYGGFDDAGNGILNIDCYDIQLNQWSLVTSAPGSLSKTWPQSIGLLSGKFYMSVFHTPNTFKIMQKGYYYLIDKGEWVDAPVINEKARYCPTCTLAFPRRIFNTNLKCESICLEKTSEQTVNVNPADDDDNDNESLPRGDSP